jgi:DNA-binding transcriptional LysR family regulator
MMNKNDLSRVDLNLLVLFEIVLEELHVGRAAARLNLTASAVSHGLSRLRALLNDPLFLRTPKGVVPTERATNLAEPIKGILDSARRVIATAEPFDPLTSTRRFMIGAPDAVSTALLPSLLETIRRTAPGIDIGVRNLLPNQMSWAGAYADLDARKTDVALLPFTTIAGFSDAPARFVTRPLYDEVFVVAMRAGHPFADEPTLARYCAMQHALVSESGDRRGYIDTLLADRGVSRRVALTVPNFMTAIAVVAQTDFLAALPSRFVARYATRYGVIHREIPLEQHVSRIRAVAPKVALMDAGLVWLFELIEQTARAGD